MKTKKVAVFVVLMISAFLCVGNAFAGSHDTRTVTVNKTNDNNGTATGTFLPTATSSNTVEFIECSIYATYPDESTQVACKAVNASSVLLSCISWDPPAGMLAAVSSINSNSRIQFTVSNGECSTITVIDSSKGL
jgi:hypothetical protein